LSLVGFIVREFRTRDPIVQLRIFANRNFGLGTLIATLYGFTFYGVIAMLPLFLQTLLGYSALDSGLAVSPRGLGSLLSMAMMGVLVNYIDSRILLACGFTLLGYSTLMLSHINLGISINSVIVPNFINGFAGGLIFVPLTTLTMSYLRREEIGNASGIYNLMRNIGGSIGIAAVTTNLVRGAQAHQNYLGANLAASNPTVAALLQGLQAKFQAGGASASDAHQMAVGAIYRSLQQQASLLAYADNFRLLGFLALLCIPLVVLFRRKKAH
jgi:DHA2 family multidrug resistance protein